MAFTKVTAAGINTGGSFVLENINTSGIITASAVNVGSAVTISSSGANVTGIVTAGTVQVGSATTIHTTGIDLGGGTLTSHNINSTGIITATSGFDGNLTGNVTGDLTGNVTGNVSSTGANTLGSLTVTNDATVGGALTVTGDFTVNGTTTTIDTIVTAVDSLAVDGNVTAGGNLDITGISTFQNDVNFAGATGVTSAFFDKSDNSLKFFDSTKAKFGTGNDLEIYHDGTHSHVREVGTGDLRLRSSKIQLMNPSSEPYFIGNSDGAVELYYDNSKKFETTGTGVTITGDARVTGILTVGTASVTIDGSQDFPTIRPILDLNFAATKTLDRRITFTRDSIGTYTDELGIIRTAPNNVPRFDHDPETGESLGLLVEESRTNYYTQNTDLTQNLYTALNVNISITTGATAPYPGYNFTTFTTTSATNTLRCYPNITYPIAPNDYWTCSVYVDVNNSSTGRMTFALGSTGSNHNFGHLDINADGTIAVSTQQTVFGGAWDRTVPITSGYQYFGNGLYRVYYVVQNQTNDTTNWYLLGYYPSGNKPLGWKISLFGSQVEKGYGMTSFIPAPTASTVTRSADVASMTGTNFSSWYNQSEGTWFGEVKKAYPTTQRLLEVGDSSNNQYSVSIRPGPTSTSFARIASSAPTVTHTYPAKFAFADSGTNFQGCVNGTLSTSNSTGSSPTDNKLSIGGDMSGTFSTNAIARITYYNKRLTNAQLQSLTRQ